MGTSWIQPEAASESRSWQRWLEWEVEEGESSGLTAAGLLPRTANQDPVPGSKMADGFAQSHGICLFLSPFFFFLFFFSPSELTLSSVSHCDSPIFESHCVQPTQECQSVSFALTSALAISSRLTIQWKRPERRNVYADATRP